MSSLGDDGPRDLRGVTWRRANQIPIPFFTILSLSQRIIVWEMGLAPSLCSLLILRFLHLSLPNERCSSLRSLMSYVFPFNRPKTAISYFLVFLANRRWGKREDIEEGGWAFLCSFGLAWDGWAERDSGFHGHTLRSFSFYPPCLLEDLRNEKRGGNGGRMRPGCYSRGKWESDKTRIGIKPLELSHLLMQHSVHIYNFKLYF